ncbi:MAG: hypothetical protein RLZ18_544, partial [Actinomycetota bacterium]
MAAVMVLSTVIVSSTSSFGIQPVHAEVGGIPAQFSAARAGAKKFSSGWSHSCFLREDGFPVCWGVDADGAVDGVYGSHVIGDSPSEMGGGLIRMVPRTSNGTIVPATAVATGGSASCLIDSNSALRCWGRNTDGNLGIGSTVSAGLGNAVPFGSDQVSDVVLGGNANSSSYFTCALFQAGTVKCWGSNSHGQLGIGNIVSPNNKIGDTSGEIEALAPINFGTGVTATAVSAGSQFACAIASGGTRNLPSGSVLCWGDNSNAQLGIGNIVSPNNIIGDSPSEMGDALSPVNLGAGRSALAISAGDNFVCALRDNYTVVCWGTDYYGTLGQNLTFATKIGDAPNEIAGLSPISLGLNAGETVVQVESGFRHACALTSASRLKCWGYNNRGQLGLGNITDFGLTASPMSSLSFVDVGLAAGETITTVSAGSRFTCVLTSLNAVKCWGGNSSPGNDLSGALGIGDVTSPKDNIGDGAGEMGSNLQAVDLAATTPVAPTDITAVGSLGTLTITFTPPAATYGAIVGYSYNCRLNPSGGYSGSFTTFAGSPLVLTSVNSSAVANGSSYRCRIRAATSVGPGVEGYVDGLAGVPLTVTASSHTVVPGAPVPTITGTPSVSGVVRASETCTTTYTTSSAAGTYPTTCSGGTAATYGITYVAGVITVATPLTVTASSHSVTVGDAVPAITGTPSINGVTRTNETCTTTYTRSSPPGSYPTTCVNGTASGYLVSYVSGAITAVAPPTTPTTIAQSSGVSSITATTTSTVPVPTLVTPSNQTQLEAKPGAANAIINGKEVAVEVVKAPVEATTEQLKRTADSIVADIADLLPSGVANPVSARTTPSGVVINGIMVNPDDPKEKLGVPVESVQL